MLEHLLDHLGRPHARGVNHHSAWGLHQRSSLADSIALVTLPELLGDDRNRGRATVELREFHMSPRGSHGCIGGQEKLVRGMGKHDRAGIATLHHEISIASKPALEPDERSPDAGMVGDDGSSLGHPLGADLTTDVAPVQHDGKTLRG
jgi:hypothetical protein